MGLFERRIAPGERLRLDTALGDAFAPLRERRSATSAARVRARALWHERDGAPAWGGIALVARVGEMSVALGVSALFFVGALGGVTDVAPLQTSDADIPMPAVRTVGMGNEDARFLRWFRLDRPVPMVDMIDATVASVTIADGADRSALAMEQAERLGLSR